MEVPTVTDVPPERPASSFVGNIIWPRPGRCFRMVADRGRGGSPIACPEPVVWRGMVTRPDGVRGEVEACEGHAGELVTQGEVSRRGLKVRNVRPGADT